MFNLYMGTSPPKVEIVSATARAVASAADSATHEGQVVVRNTGRLATALEQAKRVKIVQPDRIAARFARGSGSRSLGRDPEFWLGGGETRTVRLRIKAGARPEDKRSPSAC